MKDFQRKRKIRKRLYSPLVLIVIFFLLILVGKATLGLYVKERESRKNLNRAEAELSALMLREERLRADIARLETPGGIEAEIRGQFQVAKPGERMVVLVDDGKDAPRETAAERPLVSKFFDLFR